MRRAGRVIVSFVFCVAAGFKICRAEDVGLDKIVVTPSRIEESYEGIARKVDVVTAKEIESSGASNAAEVLTGITSVNISDYGSLGALKTIKMRGSNTSQVLVLVDGRPINSPRDGEVDLSGVPLDNIDRIEVMHGPASDFYGAQAMGGVVNIITKNPPKEKQKTEIISSFGTFRTYQEQISHGAKISKFGYLLTSGYQSSEGFRDNSEFYAKDFNAKFDYQLNDDNDLILNSGFYKSDLGTPGTIKAPDIDDKQRKRKNFLDLNWKFRPDDVTEFSAKIYSNYDRLEFMENTGGSAYETAFSKSIQTTNTRGLDLQFNKQLFENYQVITGLNYVKNINDSTNTDKHNYIVRAGYLENQLGLTKDLKVNLGARLDDYSNFGTETNPSFSFLYALSRKNKLHGLASRAFRAPTFNDLYWPDEGYQKGNPSLKPETAVNFELGLESKFNEHYVTDLTYYRSNYKELINWAEAAGVWSPENIGSAAIDGIEFDNKIYLTEKLEFGLGYTFLKAKDAKTHKYLIYQPKNKVDLSFKYKGPNGFLFDLKGQFTDRRFHDPSNTIFVKRFFIFGIGASKKFNRGPTCFVSIDNLLNRKYQIRRDYPLPGFSLTGGLKIDF